MSKLSLKQKRFADEYIISGNVYQSLINAGYSNNYAKSDGCKILENPSVKKYIEEKLNEIEASKYLSVEEALKITASIARGEPREIEVYVEEAGNWAKQKIYPSFKDSNSALDHIYKINGKYVEKKNVSILGEIDNNVVIKIIGDDDDD